MTDEGKDISSNDEQPSKAKDLTSTTDEGIDTIINDRQFLKTAVSI